MIPTIILYFIVARIILGIHRDPTLIHWNFFINLEEDLERLSRFVDFSERNNATFSIEIARLLMGASAEVDVVLKQLVVKHNNLSKADSINSYFPEITANCPSFVNYEVTIPRFGLTLTPWTNWTNNSPPLWWQANNKVKHHRHQHFEQASLKNCLNAVAALFISVIHLYSHEAETGELLSMPRLFNVGDVYFGGTKMGRFGNSFLYKTR